MFSSPDVKLDLGTAQGYASVKVTNGTYVSKNNDKLKNLTFDYYLLTITKDKKDNERYKDFIIYSGCNTD